VSKDPPAPHRSRARGGPLQEGRSSTSPARGGPLQEGRSSTSPARGGPLQEGRSGDLTLPARGLLFDEDGVLVDSDAAVTASWSRWATEHGLLPAEVVAVVYGRRAAAGRAAGARVLGVGQRALGSGADLVVGDLTGVSWADGVLTVAAGSVLRARTP
jgi:hypothetical protein